MPSKLREARQAELEAIRLDNDGILRARDVVDYAQEHEDSAIREWFDWDDDSAAYHHRLNQARQLIQVYVRVEHVSLAPTRTYVSLESDRYERGTGGGYREIRDVLTDPVKRGELVAQALKEAGIWRSKYQYLDELARIFDAMDEEDAA